MSIEFAKYYPNYSDDKSENWLESAEYEDLHAKDYMSFMVGKIFCPVCHSAVTRVPKLKEVDRLGRAYFSHPRDIGHSCEQKSQARVSDENMDDDRKSVATIKSGGVVTVNFCDSSDESSPNESGEHDVSSNASDIEGVNRVGVSDGKKKVSAANDITTMRAITRDFKENLKRPYDFPHSDEPDFLKNQLLDVNTVFSTTSSDALYFGRVTRVVNWNNGKNPLVQFFMKYQKRTDSEPRDRLDICLKVQKNIALKMGLTEESKDNVLLMYGAISDSGIGYGLEISNPAMVATLPSKYHSDLKPLEVIYSNDALQ